jgi:hypothetical protein
MERAARRAAKMVAGFRALGRCSGDDRMTPWAPWLRQVRLGPPRQRGAVTAIPLCGRRGSVDTPLVPLGVALSRNILQVEELAAAAVGRLMVTNRSGHAWVLGMGGEMIFGGRQDRVLNSSFVVGPDRSVEVAVSCVEQNRWSGSVPFARQCQHRGNSHQRHALF